MNAATLALEPLSTIAHPIPKKKLFAPGEKPYDLIVPKAKRRRIKQFAYQHRRKPTPAEAKLWLYIRKDRLGVTFHRQWPVNGMYIPDFLCKKLKLIIEVDGNCHEPIQRRTYDSLRTQYLERMGYTVIRVTNKQVMLNIERVLAYIRSFIRKLSWNISWATQMENETQERRRLEFLERCGRIKGETAESKRLAANPPVRSRYSYPAIQPAKARH